jgi:hypothetical protein
MIETGAMPSALLGDCLTLTIGKKVDWKYFFINKRRVFYNEEPIAQERGNKRRADCSKYY